MKLSVALFLALAAVLVIGCGGAVGGSNDTGSTGTPTTSTTSGGGGTSTGTFDLSTAAGTYTGPFGGANTQHLKYSGTGTGSIGTDGAASFTYSAKTTGGAQVVMDRSFSGTVDSKGAFTGTTPQVLYPGTAVEYFPATGTVSQTSATVITVKMSWDYPYSNGGTFYTSTESWTLTKKAS